MSNIIKALEQKQLRELPALEIGSTVKVNFKIIEGEKERIQPFEGVVIGKHLGPKDSKATFTVRKVSTGGHGVERVFPLHSPRIDSIEVVRFGEIRRSKLYFLRDRAGKAARIKEKLVYSK